ncbi:MAG: HNH endonuclease [Rhodospirillaceae bacterium]|nr:HNH endonuclease [Rhodospirillaceae bacterium]
MSDNVISYLEMCRREKASLQAGMNFGLGGNHSVVLMSVRPNAPYRDRLEDGGTTLVYEGHDQPKSEVVPDPKLVDQPLTTHTGRPTQNGKFFQAAKASAKGERPPERVRVYEKIRPGIWTYNGMFHLIDAWTERDERRTVCKFKLVAVENDEDLDQPVRIAFERRRIIPANVKLEVWQRDQGKCAICGAADELHFDHIVPYAKGGTSVTATNVQLLCARHNLAKSDRIQ